MVPDPIGDVRRVVVVLHDTASMDDLINFVEQRMHEEAERAQAYRARSAKDP